MKSKEEIAEERYGNMPFGIGVERRSIFIAGAKWQEDNSDKKYTEEDIRKVIDETIKAERSEYIEYFEEIEKAIIIVQDKFFRDWIYNNQLTKNKQD